jgi:hypothetical protein
MIDEIREKYGVEEDFEPVASLDNSLFDNLNVNDREN